MLANEEDVEICKKLLSKEHVVKAYDIIDRGVTYHVFHTRYEGRPLTLSTIIDEGGNYPLVVCTLQKGWVEAPEVLLEIQNARARFS